MNDDQLNSLVRTLMKMIGAVLAAHGAAQLSTALNTPAAIETIGGVISAAIAIWGSHRNNATQTDGGSNAQVSTIKPAAPATGN